MRVLCIVAAVCTLSILASGSQAGVPGTVSYQGRLTTAGGAAVPDGSYLMRFSLWTDSTGGSESWNESQTVDVAGGLFSAELGRTVGIFETCPTVGCDEWLQIEVTIGGGVQTISPRTHLSATPWSLVSRAYYSEVSSGAQRATGAVSGSGGGGGGGFNPAQTIVLEGDADGDGHAEYSLHDSVTTGSGSREIGHDLTGDGIPDIVVASSVDGSSAHFEVGDKPTQDQFGTLIESSVNLIDDRALLGLRSLNGLPPGTPVIDNLAMETNGDSASVALRSLNGLPPGTPWEDNIHLRTNGASSTIGINETLPYVKLHVSKTTNTLTNIMAADVDGDGLEDRTFSSTCDGSSSRYLLRAGVPLRSSAVAVSTTPDSAVSVTESDADGDGIAEARRLVLVSGSTGSSSKLQHYGGGVLIHEASTEVDAVESRDHLKSYFENGDVPTQERVVNSSGAYSKAINTKGTGATVRVASEASDSALTVMDCDDDGDGVARAVIVAKCKDNHLQGAADVLSSLRVDVDDDGVSDVVAEMAADNDSASLRLNGLPPGEPVIGSLSMSAGSGGGKQIIRGGMSGSTTGTIRMQATPDSAVSVTELDTDGDGVPEGQMESMVTPTTCGVAINTKGTGADKGRTISSTTYPDSAVQVISSDEDGDGNREVSLETKLKNLGLLAPAAVQRLTVDSDDDGTPDNSMESIVTPTTSGVAIKTKGTGADPNRVIGSTDDTTAVMLLATDSGSISLRTRKGGNVNGSITINNGSLLRASLGSDGVAYCDSALGVGVPSPSHPIEVAGGAYCDGTNWVNASDAGAKENFQPIDGAELLERLAGLEITKWNYKGIPGAEHIGPTAQDFQAAFGVGSDGKSISTIDPSGIALAAIQELHRENNALKAENAELKKQLDQLARSVAALAQDK